MARFRASVGEIPRLNAGRRYGAFSATCPGDLVGLTAPPPEGDSMPERCASARGSRRRAVLDQRAHGDRPVSIHPKRGSPWLPPFLDSEAEAEGFSRSPVTTGRAVTSDGEVGTARPPVDRRPLGGFTRRRSPRRGLRPGVRFAIAAVLTAGWVAFAVWASGPWRDQLADAIGPVMAWVIPVFLAYVPGLVIGFMIFTLLITHYREIPLTVPHGDWDEGRWPSVTVVIAAYNEQDAIVPTLERIAGLTYEGRIEVVLADNNSSDRTAELAAEAAQRLRLDYRRVFEAKPGKHQALNAVLPTVTTPIVVTVDADTHLQREALTLLVYRFASTPQDQHVCACAGALVAENAHANYVTRMQEWDYRLGINGVKRMQAAYNTTLVAQGAFSAYSTEDLRAVGGWPDAIGEDIVLTWTMLGSEGSSSTSPSRSPSQASPRNSAASSANAHAGHAACSREYGSTRHGHNLASSRSSSPESTTSSRSSTSESSSSGCQG